MINKLLLLSGNDIPFVQAQINIHQPTLKEIAYLGQQNFFIGCEYLIFSKDNLSEQDKNHLTDISDFEILMRLLRSDDIVIKRNKVCMEMVLTLLFPQYQIDFLPTRIRIFKKLKDNNIQQHFIDETNFELFKIIIKEMFCLDSIFNKVSQQYNPGGPQARALVQKFKKRHQKLAQLKHRGKQDQAICIMYTYLSILSVGKDLNILLQYTFYQLFKQFQRFKAKEDFYLYIKFKIAGAKDLQDIENWMSNEIGSKV